MIDKLCSALPRDVYEYVRSESDRIREIRLRIGKPVQIISDRDRLVGDALSRAIMRKVLMIATDFSLYTKEDEIRNGFFTLSDGSRVGVCGAFDSKTGHEIDMSNVGSISIRIAREKVGCAAALKSYICDESGKVAPTLLYSLPGMGKTTFLRDISRILSDEGFCVGIADERHEIAACVQGVPTLDVGTRSDVCDGALKSESLMRLIRTMSPDVLITDEIGSAEDAKAIKEAIRCGISVIASAHGSCFKDLMMRESIKDLIASGVFRIAVHLGGTPGNIMDLKMAFHIEGGGIRWESV